jgi:hypothetical protein
MERRGQQLARPDCERAQGEQFDVGAMDRRVQPLEEGERREKASPRNSFLTVYLLYTGPDGTVFDQNCAGWLKTKIDPQRVAETARRAPELQALWDKEGPR